MQNEDFKRKVKFILRFGRALHAVGSPAHTLEGYMQELCQLLGLKGSIVSTPTAIFSSFREGEEEVARIERVEPMGVNLGKLSQVDCVARELLQGQKTYEEASQKLDDIFNEPDLYGKRMILTCFVFYAAGFVVLLGGTWGDFLSSIIVGSIIGLFSMVKPDKGVSQLFEALMAIVASLATYLLAKLIPGLNGGVIILSSLVMFLPGLYITIAIA